MRARNLKPGFFENEVLAELPFEHRICYEGLWCYADREGRFEWRPKRIKALIFPYDKLDINKLLADLILQKFVIHYEVDGEQFGYIPTFLKHQNPHPHEAKSKLPAPPGNCQSNQCHDMSLHATECNRNVMLNPDSLNPDSLNPESIEELRSSCSELHGISKQPTADSVVSIPILNGKKEYGITQDEINAWSLSYPAVDIYQTLRNIREWNLSHPSKQKTERGIRAHITGWLAREQNRGGNKNNDQPSRSDLDGQVSRVTRRSLVGVKQFLEDERKKRDAGHREV